MGRVCGRAGIAVTKIPKPACDNPVGQLRRCIGKGNGGGQRLWRGREGEGRLGRGRGGGGVCYKNRGAGLPLCRRRSVMHQTIIRIGILKREP